jgi:flagellar basal body-associated protein FliL
MDETTEPDAQDTAPEAAMTEPGSEEAPIEAQPRADGVSRTVFIVSLLVAMAVAGAAGVLIGWKVEQQRVKDDLANIRPVGEITELSSDELTVDLVTASGTRTYVITEATVISGANDGQLAEGSKVLVKSRRNADGDLRAIEIVVLGDTTTFGQG